MTADLREKRRGDRCVPAGKRCAAAHPSEKKGTLMNIDILFENRDLVVCLKPVGVLSEQAQHGEMNMPELLRAHFAQNGDDCAAYPVHRLDMGTGGTMVYAKNKKTAAALSAAICAHETEKYYLAVVHGVPEPEEGSLRDLIYRRQELGKAFIADRPRRGVKEAVLSYTVLEMVQTAEGILSLLLIRLGTGRFHQIRVQFASRRHPLAGDGKYGARDSLRHPALWACRLVFPYRGRVRGFSAPPPEEEPWSFFSPEVVGRLFSTPPTDPPGNGLPAARAQNTRFLQDEGRREPFSSLPAPKLTEE